MNDLSQIRVGIIGLGLIGGSIARALSAKAGIKNIVSVSRNDQALREAYDLGVISAYGTDYKLLADCDIVYICTPVSRIIPTAIEVSHHCTGILTDVGSTKSVLINSINQLSGLRFVGGHPMAGSEKFGFSASVATLYENAPYILCPSVHSTSEDVELVRALAASMGAQPLVMPADEHDRSVGLISHLPHVAAYSLVNLVADADKGLLRSLAAGGFKDVTRIASSNPEMWADIVEDSAALTTLLDEYITCLEHFRSMLIENRKDEITKFFASAKVYRDSLPNRNAPQLWVEVADQPGVIGRITSLFGEQGINIKNIHIEDSREYEGGCLRITLKTEQDAQAALTLLTQEGMECSLKR